MRCTSSYHYSDFQKHPSHPKHQLPVEHPKTVVTGQPSCHSVPHFKAHLPGSGGTARQLVALPPPSRPGHRQCQHLRSHQTCCHDGGHAGRDELNQTHTNGYHDTAPKAGRGAKKKVDAQNRHQKGAEDVLLKSQNEPI